MPQQLGLVRDVLLTEGHGRAAKTSTVYPPVVNINDIADLR
jgi:hypothetical protein